MILHVFSVYDVKADLYGTPFFMPSVGQAVRAFTDLANDAQSHVSRYPDDFRLEQIGVFTDHNGRVESCEPKVLGFARDYVRAVAPVTELREVKNG